LEALEGLEEQINAGENQHVVVRLTQIASLGMDATIVTNEPLLL